MTSGLMLYLRVSHQKEARRKWLLLKKSGMWCPSVWVEATEATRTSRFRSAGKEPISMATRLTVLRRADACCPK